VSADIHLDKNAEDIIPNRVKEYEELLLSSTLSESSEKKRLTAIRMRYNLEEAQGGAPKNWKKSYFQKKIFENNLKKKTS
jgi:hypothetical protein